MPSLVCIECGCGEMFNSCEEAGYSEVECPDSPQVSVCVRPPKGAYCSHTTCYECPSLNCECVAGDYSDENQGCESEQETWETGTNLLDSCSGKIVTLAAPLTCWTPPVVHLPATCSDFGYYDEDLGSGCSQVTVPACSTATRNGETVAVQADTVCYECQDTCVIDEWSWYPDPYNVCDETFTQYGYGYDSITGEYCERTRTAQGLGQPWWSEWYPYEWEQCNGVQFTQYRYDYVCGGYEEQQAVGTGGEVTWSEWDPSTDTYCVGVSFTQSRYGINCSASEQRDAVGTQPIVWSDWGPPRDTRCENQTFTQSRSSNCYTYEYRQINGSRAVVWSEWSPSAGTVCEGVSFTQTRFATNNCPGWESRSATGTKAPVWGDWTPSTDTVCAGEPLEQSRKSDCGGYEEQQAVGTKDCSVGCTNPNSPNFSSSATQDDGSCVTCANAGNCVVPDPDGGANCNGIDNGCCDEHCKTAGDCSPTFQSSFTAANGVYYPSCYG